MNHPQHAEWNEGLPVGDLLVGAPAIHAYLVQLRMPTDTDVYYLKRARNWPIGNTATGARTGGKLVASKRRPARHAEMITRGPSAAGEE
jgi:hypothetical protein